MKAILIAPIFMTLILGFSLQLVDIAESASEQSVDFAQDMSNAIPCATRGIPLEKCSPNLGKHSFEDDIHTTLHTLETFNNETRVIRDRIQQEQLKNSLNS